MRYIRTFISIFQFLVVKISIYLNRHVFVQENICCGYLLMSIHFPGEIMCGYPLLSGAMLIRRVSLR